MALEARAEITLLGPDEVQGRIAEKEPPLVIAVREPGEYQRGHIPGAVTIPRGVLELKADLEHPMRDQQLAERSRPVITYCMGGLGE